MISGCCDCTPKIMLLSCSGGCPEGQLANQAAVELTREGFGEMFCLAGIGTGKSGFVQSVRDVSRFVVIDGCSKACGRAILEKAGVIVANHIVVSQLAIGSSKELTPAPDHVAAVKYSTKLALGEPISVTFRSPKPLSPADMARSRMLGGKCC